MARTRGPGNLVARRPTTEARVDASAHRDYAAMIEQDLGGRRASSYRAIDEGRPATAGELLLRPLSLFLFACTAFVIVLLLWLWQAGVFGALKLDTRPVPPAPSTSWMGARQMMPPVSSGAPASLLDPSAMTKPAAGPTDAPEGQDDDTAESEDGPAE